MSNERGGKITLSVRPLLKRREVGGPSPSRLERGGDEKRETSPLSLYLLSLREGSGETPLSLPLLERWGGESFRPLCLRKKKGGVSEREALPPSSPSLCTSSLEEKGRRARPHSLLEKGGGEQRERGGER